MAELLAYYLHMVLSGKVCNTAGKVVSHLSVAEINEQSNSVLEIFPMLNNKDMFGDCYQALLMKRLLRRTFNEDNEKHVLSTLKSYQGINYVRAMETMFMDLISSQNAQKTFLPYWNSKQDNIPDKHPCKSLGNFQVTVLTRTAWPPNLQNMQELNLPDAVEMPKSLFYMWYRERNKSRELGYHWLQSRAILSAKFPKLNPRFNEIQLEMTALQAMLLLGFDRNRLKSGHSLKELAMNLLGRDCWDPASNRPTNRSHWDMLVSLLKSLLKPFPDCRGSLIMKGPKPGPPILPTDKLRLNPKFQSRKRKVTIHEPADWRKQFDPDRAIQARKHVVEAAVVRVMKARTLCTHTNLTGEVVKQITTFKCSAKEVRKVIGGLIDREYIKRDPENSQAYIYLS